MTESDNQDIEQLSFEEALKKLEGIVDDLEGGDVSLADSIATFERGSALKKHCEKTLRNAEMKVEEIVQRPDGSVETKPLDYEDDF